MSFFNGYLEVRMDRIVLVVVRGGFFLGLVVDMKMLMLGRLDLLLGFFGDGVLNCFFNIFKFVSWLMGYSFGS